MRHVQQFLGLLMDEFVFGRHERIDRYIHTCLSQRINLAHHKGLAQMRKTVQEISDFKRFFGLFALRCKRFCRNFRSCETHRDTRARVFW